MPYCENSLSRLWERVAEGRVRGYIAQPSSKNCIRVL